MPGSDTQPDLTPEQIEAIIRECHKELTALGLAWIDRGLDPDQVAVVLGGSAHALMAACGLSLATIQAQMAINWAANGGKP